MILWLSMMFSEFIYITACISTSSLFNVWVIFHILPLIYSWTFRCFHLTTVNSAAVNLLYASFYVHICSQFSWAYIPRSRISGPYGSSILTFWGIAKLFCSVLWSFHRLHNFTCLPAVCEGFCASTSSKTPVLVPFLYHDYCCVKWYLIVGLFAFPYANAVKLSIFFMCLLEICIFFWRNASTVLWPFFN